MSKVGAPPLSACNSRGPSMLRPPEIDAPSETRRAVALRKKYRKAKPANRERPPDQWVLLDEQWGASPDGEPGLNYLSKGLQAFYKHVLPEVERITAKLRSHLHPSDHDEPQCLTDSHDASACYLYSAGGCRGSPSAKAS